jgi:hypothetical protein
MYRSTPFLSAAAAFFPIIESPLRFLCPHLSCRTATCTIQGGAAAQVAAGGVGGVQGHSIPISYSNAITVTFPVSKSLESWLLTLLPFRYSANAAHSVSFKEVLGALNPF